MGRPKYTEAERTRIMTAFIRAARTLIEDEGIEQVSIRKIAARTGLNSATMYLYFPDVDVLTTMASMPYLEKYCSTLAADMEETTSPEDRFFRSWDVFSRFAFADPEIFYHVFYHEHSVPLAEIVDRYYQLDPAQVESVRGSALDLLRAGTLSERCWTVLWPVAEARGLSEAEANVANEMSVAYFRQLLEARCKDSADAVKSEHLTQKLNTALELLLKQTEN